MDPYSLKIDRPISARGLYMDVYVGVYNKQIIYSLPKI